MREVGGSIPSSPIGPNRPAGWGWVAESVLEWSLPGWLGKVAKRAAAFIHERGRSLHSTRFALATSGISPENGNVDN